MSRIFFLGFVTLLLPSVVSAKPDFGRVTESLGLPNPLAIELQGEVGAYTEQQLGDLDHLLKNALGLVRDWAPITQRPHFFSPNPERRNFQNRSFRVVLTDMGNESDSSTTADFRIDANGKPRREELTAFLRVDKLVYDPGGCMQRYALPQLVTALVKEILGTWSVHLGRSLPSLWRMASPSINELDILAFKQTSEIFSGLLTHPSVQKDRNAGVYLGSFFEAWVQSRAFLRFRTGGDPNAFAVATNIRWEDQGLYEPSLVKGARLSFYRALHLVHSVVPPDIQRSLFADPSQRVFQLRVRKSKPSSGFYAAETSFHRDYWPVVSTELWADRVFFTGDGFTNMTALASATVALASQLYEAAPALLYPPFSPASEGEILRRGADFVDLLVAHPLWASLTVAERSIFLSVRDSYHQAAGAYTCESLLRVERNLSEAVKH